MAGLSQPERTFCNVPFCPDIAGLEADVAIIGAPHGTPYKPGTPSHAANGASAVRAALGWYSANPEQYDFDSETNLFGGARVVDCGDVPGDLNDGAANRRAIGAAVEAALQGDVVPLVLGGDDSVPIPVIGAIDRHELTIVQVDAHIDWRDEVDGVREGFSSTMRRASEMAHVRHIVQIGARGPGSARASDRQDARDWGAVLYTARKVQTGGIAPALDHVVEGTNVFLSIDVDGIDPSVVPGVILPAFGGLTYEQVLEVVHGVAARAWIAGAAFVEYVPERDPTGIGAQAIARIASNVIAAIGVQRAAEKT